MVEESPVENSYEAARNENVQRNKDFLAQLGMPGAAGSRLRSPSASPAAVAAAAVAAAEAVVADGRKYDASGAAEQAAEEAEAEAVLGSSAAEEAVAAGAVPPDQSGQRSSTRQHAGTSAAAAAAAMATPRFAGQSPAGARPSPAVGRRSPRIDDCGAAGAAGATSSPAGSGPQMAGSSPVMSPDGVDGPTAEAAEAFVTRFNECLEALLAHPSFVGRVGDMFDETVIPSLHPPSHPSHPHHPFAADRASCLQRDVRAYVAMARVAVGSLSSDTPYFRLLSFFSEPAAAVSQRSNSLREHTILGLNAVELILLVALGRSAPLCNRHTAPRRPAWA